MSDLTIGRSETNWLVFPPTPPAQWWLDPVHTGLKQSDDLLRLQAIRDAFDRGEGKPFTTEEYYAYHRERGLRDLFFFAKFVLGYDRLQADLHADTAYAWTCPDGTDLTRGPAGLFRWATFARGHLKTTLLTKAYALLLLARDHDERILLYQSNFTVAKKTFGEIRSLLEGKGTAGIFFLDCFPELRTKKTEREKWAENALTIPRETPYSDHSLECTGTGAIINGSHFSTECVDDPIGKLENAEQMQKLFATLDNLDPLLDSFETGKRRMVMTPWGFNDPIARAEKQDPAALVARIPMFIEPDPLAPQGFKPVTDPARFTYERLTYRWKANMDKTVAKAKQIARQTGYFFSCNPAGTPILLPDWTEVPIETIKPGDFIMGFDHAAPRRRPRRRLKPAKVLACGSREAPLVRVTFMSGTTFECTADHRWWTGQHSERQDEYLPAKRRRTFVRVVQPLPVLTWEQQLTARWLGGIFDGEGSANSASLNITQSPTHNPEVCAEIERALTELGFDYGISGKEHKNGRAQHVYYLRGGREAVRRFLLLCEPARKHAIYERLDKRRGSIGIARDQVISVEDTGRVATVYSMQTESGNYVAHGYASKNCQFAVYPRREGTIGFRPDWFRRFTRRGDILVEHEMDGRDGKKIPLAACNIFITVDPIGGDKRGTHGPLDPNRAPSMDTDYVGIAVVAVSDENMWYLLDAKRKRYNDDEFLRVIFDLVGYYHPRSVHIEGTGGQRHIFKGFLDAWKRGKPMFVLGEWAGGNASKAERIRGLIPKVSEGFLLFRTEAPPAIQEDIDACMQELLDGETSPHDDAKDALSAMLQIAYAPSQNQEDARQLQLRSLAEDDELATLDPTSRWAWGVVRKKKGENRSHFSLGSGFNAGGANA
jgi:hypothetical protein